MTEQIEKPQISPFFSDIIDTRGGILTTAERKIIVSMLKEIKQELKELRQDIVALQEVK